MPPDIDQPLLHVVLCCTSIPPEIRSKLAGIATSMGAAHKLDLTTDVTHLIVGDIDTPKYKYVAKERPDIKCLRPEWIEALQQKWMQGGDTDVETLEAKYKLPTFSGLRICVTGFEDLTIRKQLEDQVIANGGDFRGDLTKNVSHLIAYKPTGAKYNFAKSWGIRIVSVEWLEQSLERGMVLDESLYDPLIEVSERGKNSWNREAPTLAVSNKRPREEVGKQGPRKLRRTASARSISENFWPDIVARGVEVEDIKRSEWDEQPSVERMEPENDSNIRNTEATDNNVRPLLQVKRPLSQGLFHGKKFYLHGFDATKTTILEAHLNSHDAEIVTQTSELSQVSGTDASHSAFVLVPHTTSDSSLPPSLESNDQWMVVTDMWIELCLHGQKYVEPQANLPSTPFRYPIAGFEELVVSSTAFEDIDLLHVSKIVKLLGATYHETLSPDVSVLICNEVTSSREKLRFALLRNIPAVNANWLWDSMRSCQRKEFDEYLVRPEFPTKSQSLESRRANRNSKNGREREGSEVSAMENDSLKRSDRVIARSEKELRDKKQSHNPPAFNTDRPPEKSVQESSQTADDSGQIPTTTPPFSTISTAPLTAIPFQELATNSLPRSSRLKSPSLAPPDLSSDITSLLSLHQQQKSESSSNPSNHPAAGPSTHFPSRRKRRLFGRAPSNLSLQSANNSIPISRASSVDTMNTDGIGTPLEGLAPLSSVTISGNSDALTAELLATSEELAHDANAEKDEPPPMTQLGYEDPEAGMWRERLTRKMGGLAELAGPEKKRDRTAGTVKESVLGGVTRKTRTGGRA